MNIKIVPTIFVTEEKALVDRIELYEEVVERVQLDVADKEFTTKPTLGVKEMVEQPSILQREVHLMVLEPVEFLEVCKKAGVWLATGQIENMSSQKEFVAEAKDLGLKVGLAVDLETDLAELNWITAKDCDQLLVMTVRAGEEGQELSEAGLDKVKALRSKGYQGEICVDGGVNQKTIKRCVKAGADVLAVGSALCTAYNVKQKYKELRRLANEV